MPDPKLQAVMQELLSVLEKHDVAGALILSSPSHLEYAYKLDTSWVCIRFGPEPGEVRIRCKRADFASVADQKRMFADTVGTLMGFADASRHTIEDMNKLTVIFGKHADIDHITKHEDRE